MYAFLVAGLVVFMAVLMLPPYVAIYRRWFVDCKNGFWLIAPKRNTNRFSKAHFLRQLRWADRHVEIITGAMHVSVWDAEVARAFEKALSRHPDLVLRILAGPEVYAYADGTHPVYDLYDKTKASWGERWEIRFLKEYPHEGQGRCSDVDLYLELEDGAEMEERPIATYYQDYDGPHPEEIAQFLVNFEMKWTDSETQSEPLKGIKNTDTLNPKPKDESLRKAA